MNGFKLGHYPRFAIPVGYDWVMQRALDIAAVMVAMAGAVVGTIALCDMGQHTWGIVGWSVSLISLVRILATSRKDSEYFLERFALASVAVFCFLILIVMRPMDIAGLILGAVGIAAGGAVIWMKRG